MKYLCSLFTPTHHGQYSSFLFSGLKKKYSTFAMFQRHKVFFASLAPGRNNVWIFQVVSLPN